MPVESLTVDRQSEKTIVREGREGEKKNGEFSPKQVSPG